AIGSALMLGGSFITQGNAGKGEKKASTPLPASAPIPTMASQAELAAPEPKPKPTFQPRVFSGYASASARRCAMAHGPPGLPAGARREHVGRRLPRLYGSNAVLLADLAQAWCLG